MNRDFHFCKTKGSTWWLLSLVCVSFLTGNLMAQDNLHPAPKYQLADKEFTVESEPTLAINISIDPKHLNQEDMKALAQTLNKDFSKEKKLSVLIFNDYQSARSFVPHPHSPTYKRDLAAICGGYFLNRNSGEEYIYYVPDPSKPKEQIRIEISRPQQ